MVIFSGLFICGYLKDDLDRSVDVDIIGFFREVQDNNSMTAGKSALFFVKRPIDFWACRGIIRHENVSNPVREMHYLKQGGRFLCPTP